MENLTKEEATDFFAELFYGENHIPSEIQPCGQGWKITYHSEFATYDFNQLTRLVLMAHDQCIRAGIQGSNFGKISIRIWKRQREGSIMERHPTIEQAIEQFRNPIKK